MELVGWLLLLLLLLESQCTDDWHEKFIKSLSDQVGESSIFWNDLLEVARYQRDHGP